jgi:uncharacterized protein (DUF1499 family)
VKRLGGFLIGLPAAIVVVFAGLGMYSKTGGPPGIQNGQLAACPPKPNCVSSESAPTDSHSIPGIQIGSTVGKDPLESAQKSIVELGGQVNFTSDNYLAATFTSGLFGFVDDLEMQIDSGSGLIHVRSASRVGYSDFNANRKRVEALRAKLTQPK